MAGDDLASPSAILRRPALSQRLAEARESALALIVAPPGYGKSTLLAEWAERDERPFAWLALGQADRRTASATLRPAPPAAAERLPQLVRKLRARHSSFVAVLDDAHLASGALRDIGQAALEELPEGSTLALASRTEPPLPVGRLRAHRLLTEIRMQQLAMSASEAAALLRQAGVELTSEELHVLVSRAEGWPAALYLAALAAREEPEALAGFGGDHHLLFEYLWDEVLAPLPAELISFSVRTSVLDELSGMSCDSVLDQQGSAVLLERLSRLTPLLTPVDPAHHRYRWHRLMREALRARLERIEPELELSLRLRASGWYSGRGDTRRATDQAAAARDAQLTGELLWPHILDHLTQGRDGLVRGWLSNFGDGVIADHPPLTLSASLSALLAGVARHLQGDRAAAELLLDEGIRLAANRAPVLSALCLAQRAMIAIEREDWPLAADLTDRAAMVVDEWHLSSDPLLAVVFSVLAASRAHEGRIDESKRDLRSGIKLLEELGDFVT
ncbi:MAG: hypothetical protein E6G05_09385, partial [Actinobacteria bacterium]